MKSTLEDSIGGINELLNSHPNHIFKQREFEMLFSQYRVKFELKKKINFEDFVQFLIQNNKLTKHEIKFPKQMVTIYSCGNNVSNYEIVLALGRNSYLSHYSAVYFHQLTDQIPKTIYLTVPQDEKRFEFINLTQKEIDEAFSKPVRSTKQYAVMGKFRIAKLTGMDTSGLGIIKKSIPGGATVAMTTLERTLIDIVVRPNYCGGIQQVLDAYSYAKERVSAQRILLLLKKLKYWYPYHQAIGFYMERAGFSGRDLEKFKDVGIEKKFYLTHGMREKVYNAKWRLFIPKGF